MSLCFEERFGAQELAVEPAERRAAIAGDKARGIEPVAAVELFLHEAEPDQGLEAGHEYAALAEVVLVVELDVAQRHSGLSTGGQFALADADIARGHENTMTYRARQPRGNARG